MSCERDGQGGSSVIVDTDSMTAEELLEVVSKKTNSESDCPHFSHPRLNGTNTRIPEELAPSLFVESSKRLE